MSNDNNEHQRLLKQQAHQEKRRIFYLKHGCWPKDSEIAEAPITATFEQIEPFDLLFEPRD